MNGNGFVNEIWELTCVNLVKSPLNTKHDKDNKNSGVAINFLHDGWFVVVEGREKK